MFSNRDNEAFGFTLVELLIVIVVLGVLVSIIIPIFGDSSDRAKASASLATLQSIRKQLHLAKIEHEEYFPDLGGGGSGWDILIQPTEPTSTPSGTYTFGNGSANDVGPYIHKRPLNPFEDSDTVSSIGGASTGVGFVYDQSVGLIKVVIPVEKLNDLELSTDDFETY